MKKHFLTILCILGLFICMLDTTIMNVSLPSISDNFGIELKQISWALNIYLILFAALTIPLTRLAEIFSINKWFLAGVTFFALGSLISAYSINLTILLIGRAVQSIGAALVFPLSMTLGIRSVPVSQRTGMIAILGITQGGAAALGPTIGGIVTEYWGWRWIFLINVPFTVLMLVIGFLVLNLHEKTNIKQPVDGLAALLSVIFLSALSLGLMQGREWGWLSIETVCCFVLSVTSFITFLVVETKSKNPMVPLELFKKRSFSVASVIIVLSNLFLVATTVILPNYCTNILGENSLHSSLLVAPISLAIFIWSPIAGFARAKISDKLLLSFGFALMLVGYFWLGKSALLSQWSIITAGFIVGSGYGIITGPILVIAAGDLEGKLLTASQSVTGVLRQIGIMLSVAIFVTALYANLSTAKFNSKLFARNEINKMILPDSVKKSVLSETNKKMEGDKFTVSEQNKIPTPLRSTVSDIERFTKSELTNAFSNLYSSSIPFLFVGMGCCFLLGKKGKKRTD